MSVDESAFFTTFYTALFKLPLEWDKAKESEEKQT
jgi:hypothetical protein